MLSERDKGQLTVWKVIAHVSIIIIGLANFIAQFLV